MGGEREEAERPLVDQLIGASYEPPSRSTLQVGPADDPQEREADRVADQVMRALQSSGPSTMGPGRVQRATGASERPEDEPVASRLQRSATSPAATINRMPAVRIQRKLAGVDTASVATTSLAEIEAINPKELDGDAYKVLHDGMAQSWNEAKHILAAGHLPVGETTEDQSKALKAMMRKLWEYRQWHHDLVLQDTRRRVNAMTNDPEGLKEWKAAGSASLTSDIDVNLKGNHTELAVQVFNETFKEFGWDFEAGIVYDVNVYAVDFMHGMGKETEGGLVVSQEGKREGRGEGGIDDEEIAALDQGMQREWTLVKTRLYMTSKEWADFKDASGGNGPDKSTFTRAETLFEEYRTLLLGAMGKQVNQTLVASDDATKTGYASIHASAQQHAKSKTHGEDISMAAANRVYEEKLKTVSSYRAALAEAVAQYNLGIGGSAKPGGPDLKDVRLRINGLLIELRDLLSECSLFANEAYLTHGAVNHGVVGLQIGKPIVMSNSAMYDAFQENLADALKEIARHGDTIGEAAYKSGKYVWRMADAADNLGVNVEEQRWLLTAGGRIANDVKNGKEDPEAASAKLVKDWLGVTTVEELRQAVIGFGMVVGAQYNQTIVDKQRSGSQAKPIAKDNWKA